MKLFDSALGIHERALDLRGQRLEVISRNIANADTPHYKAQDVDFKRVLNNAQAGRSLNTTHAGHVKSSGPPGQGGLVYTVPFNTVHRTCCSFDFEVGIIVERWA
jgi:flagellar basal-body rod protein FlgB